MNVAPTHPAVDTSLDSQLAEDELAHRAALVLAAARAGDLDDTMAGLVGDLVEAAAALALGVLGDRGMLRAEPAPIAALDHPGWIALHDAVITADPNVVRLDAVRDQRATAGPSPWPRRTAHP